MNKKWSLLGIACGLLPTILTVKTVQAASLALIPAVQSVEVGNAVEIEVVISGLGDVSAPSLSTFDLDVNFDPSILAFSSATFGDPILGDQLDLLGFGSLTDVTAGAGTVNLFELSFDLPSDLDSLQPDSFTLATLNFNAIGVGSSPLAISTVNALGDANGLPLLIEAVSGANVEVTPSTATVPEPSLSLLSLFSALGVGGFLLRKQSV